MLVPSLVFQFFKSDILIFLSQVLFVGSGLYLLNTSISNAADTCITINISDVIFDCQGYTVDGVDTGNGIFVDGASGAKLKNVTIKNCVVNDFEDGIRFDYVNNSFIINTSVNSADNSGIALRVDSDYNQLLNITLTNQSETGDEGIYLWDADYKTKPVEDLVKKRADLIINIAASPYYRDVALKRDNIIKRNAIRYGVPILYVNQIGGQDDLVFDGRRKTFEAGL